MNFEQVKSAVVGCSTKQQRELFTLLKSLLAQAATRDEAKSPTMAAPPGELLWECLRVSLRPHLASAPPNLEYIRRHQRPRADRIAKASTQLLMELQELFPESTIIERQGLVAFFTQCATSRVLDGEVAPTIERILDALVPLGELCADRFPGYSRWLLQETVMRHVKGAAHVRNEPHP